MGSRAQIAVGHERPKSMCRAQNMVHVCMCVSARVCGCVFVSL